MFKFDPRQVLTHQKLGGTHKSSVYPYLEGQEEKKWVVKCIKADDFEDLNSLLQNLQIPSAVNSSSIVPIRGYELQKDEKGHVIINIRMPRMHRSLKEIIQFGQYSNDSTMSLEQIVNYFHSIVSSLNELAQKDIVHRNLKLSNIFIDDDGLVYLSDIRMVQSSGGNIKNDRKTRDEYDDTLYKAPETFDDNWMTNQEDLYKADSWSLGMVIARACLLDSLTPILPDLPIEENKHIIKQNIALIGNKFGKHFAEIVGGLLALNPNERETFSTTRRLLEEAFPKFVVSWAKHIIKDPFDKHDPFGKQGQQMLDIKDESLGLLGLNISMSRSESNILSDNISSIKKHSTIDDGSSFQSWMRPHKFFKFKRPEWLRFRPGQFQLHRPQWLNKQSLLRGFRKGKELTRTYKRLVVSILVFIVLLIVAFKVTILRDISRQEKFAEIITGIQIKQGGVFRIDFDKQGSLDVQPTWWHTDEAVVHLMNDVVGQLEAADLMDHLTVFRFSFIPMCEVTDATLIRLQNDLVRMKNLREVIIDRINGRGLTNNAIQSLLGTLSGELKYLQSIGFGLLGQLNMSIEDKRNLITTVFHNVRTLTRFHFALDNVDINDDELLQLAHDISQNGQNLKTLRVRLRDLYKQPYNPYTQSRVSATGLKNFNSIFLTNLNDLEDLDLDFSTSPMTNDILDALGMSLTSNKKKLKRFRLAIDQCNSDLVTQNGFKYLEYQLSKEKFPDLDYLVIQIAGYYRDKYRAERDWLRGQFKGISEVHILPGD